MVPEQQPLTPEYIAAHRWSLDLTPDQAEALSEEQRELIAETEQFFDGLLALTIRNLGRDGRAAAASIPLYIKAAENPGPRCPWYCLHVPGMVSSECLCICYFAPIPMPGPELREILDELRSRLESE